jgi:hypothetical protein
MPKMSKKTITILIVLATFVVVGGIKLIFQPSGTGPKKGIPARAKGDAGAAIHIVEYVDFQ